MFKINKKIIGRISAETLVNFPEEVLPKIRRKIREHENGSNEFESIFERNTIIPSEYTIVYAIIYEGEKELHKRIPFFQN
ncbi:hypothetical protein K8O68_10490 [Salipaludibacillus sp. CUR1]|uniref:hypothetical protein n=1 Tax=Salipaludibacillus sp. CUR1 TaxID=2820003 RepID=UPI001E4ECD2D|nr:hypothetical protein [Salipaludibacillus sp. CUR1]MCE7792843.1 hypothetical protein [Salipaludibacillus sp. CUR1]